MGTVIYKFTIYRYDEHSAAYVKPDMDSQYRPAEEISYFEKEVNPITRLRLYLNNQGWWDDQEEASWLKDTEERVNKARCT